MNTGSRRSQMTKMALKISIYKYVPCMCVYGHVRVHIGIGTHAFNGEKYIIFTFTCDRVFTHMRMYHGDFGD